MSPCNDCGRPGNLVLQQAEPAMKHVGILKPWVFRYYLCPWHLGAWNRKAKKGVVSFRRLERVKELPDEEVLREVGAEKKP